MHKFTTNSTNIRDVRAQISEIFAMTKTRKSLKKRFKITRTGKVLRRATGQNHFRAKKSGKKRRETRKWVEVPKPLAKKIKRLLNY